MTIKLLAHILRSSPLAVGSTGGPAVRTPDFGRWVLEELVVRRWEPIGWRRRQALPRRLAPPQAFDSVHVDAIWSETLPCWHE